MLTPIIKSKVNDLWSKFWSGGISNPLNAIEQITYLLFMKQLDENDVSQRRKAEFKGEKYKSVFDGLYYPPGVVRIKKNAIKKMIYAGVMLTVAHQIRFFAKCKHRSFLLLKSWEKPIPLLPNTWPMQCF